jgi:predicted CoA-binding protein
MKLTKKKTVVIGASLKPGRLSHEAILRLTGKGHEVIAIGLKEGDIGGTKILKGKPDIENVDTVTLYLNAKRQKEMEDYILGLKPNRIIFNPGAENPELLSRASAAGIEAIEACTMTMLAVGLY